MTTVLVTLLALLAATPAGDVEKVAVIPLAAKRVPKETVSILDDLLLTSIAQGGKRRAVGPNDINAMLGMEKMKEVLGCDDVSCAAEIGGALGVSLIVSGTVSKLGESVIVTLSLIDARAHEVKKRSMVRAKNDENLYPQAIETAVRELFEQDAAPAASAPAKAAAAVPQQASSGGEAGAAHHYVRSVDGRLARNEQAIRWVDAVTDCIDVRLKAPSGTNVTCEFDGKPMGYELFWDGKLAGFEPGWDPATARANCAWNTGTHRDKRVECRFDGQPLDPAAPAPLPPPRDPAASGRGYEIFYDGRLARSATMKVQDAAADCIATRQKYGKSLTVTCEFDGKRMGYELFWDGELVGYEPGWDLATARANCEWNLAQNKDRRVECRFEGTPLAGR